MSLVNVYDSERGDKVVARVPYTSNLDVWSGSNYQNGGAGRHLGVALISRGKYKGRYALVHGTEWQGERDYAILATDEEALQEILKSNSDELLKDDEFARLRELAEKEGFL